MFYPPFSPLLANLSSNSSPSRRALHFGSVRCHFGCTDVEKNDDLVSVTTCFEIFEGISMFFDAFTLCWACFELSGRFKHVFLIWNDTTIIQEYVKKVEKMMSWSRLFGIFFEKCKGFADLTGVSPKSAWNGPKWLKTSFGKDVWKSIFFEKCKGFSDLTGVSPKSS